MAQDALNGNRLAVRDQQVLTWASVISFVSILLAFWAWIPCWMHSSRLSGLLFLLPFLLPYGFIPLRLHSRRVFSGLTLAVAMGCALLGPGIYVIRFLSKWERNWWILGNLILALLMQPVLVLVAAKTLIAMPRPPKWGSKFLGSLAYGVFLFCLFLAFYSPIPYQLRENEASARSYLFDTALHVDRGAFYNGGFYPMGPADIASNADLDCKGDGSWVIDLQKQSHAYFFEYAGISPSRTAEGCTRFKSFAMSARPIGYGRTGFRSYFVDKNMTVHATSENRPANPSDPVVWTLNDYVTHHRPA